MFFLLQACALFSKIEPSTCETTAECVDAFGIGNTCQLDGYCSIIEPISRCTTTNPPDFWDDPSAYEGAFVIGQMFDFAADASKLAASKLAFNDILETGSNGTWLNGRKLVQITCNYENNAGDTLVEKDAVETVTDFLVNTMGVEVIVGPAGSQDSLYATNLSDGKALFISPSATAQSIKPLTNTYTDEAPGFFWRTTGSDTLQSIRLATYIEEQEWQTIGILYQESIYGSGIGTALRDLRESETGSAPTTATFGVNNLSSIAGKIEMLMNEEGIEAIVFISDNTMDILEAIKVMDRYPTTPLLLTDSAARTELLDAIREYTGGNTDLEASIVNQVTGTKPSVPDTSQYREFVNRLSNVDGIDADSSAFAAHTYDATWLGVTALMYADANEAPHDIKGLARGLRQISDTEQPEITFSQTGWNQIKEALTANAPVNVTGVSGDLNYDENTEELMTGVDLWKFVENLLSFEIIDETTPVQEDTGGTQETGDTAN